MNIQVSDDELKKNIKEIKARFPDDKTFEMSLEQQNVTMDDFEGKIREFTLLQKVMDSISPTSPTITEAEIKEYYEKNPERFKKKEEVKASHILLKMEQGASKKDKEEVKKKIEEILKKVKNGEDFAKLASDNSDCPSGKRAGGDLGWFGRGQMVPPFEQAAFSMKPGELSEVVETDFGFHIIKLTDKHEEGVTSLNEAKDDLREELADEVRGKAFMDWLIKEKKERVIFTNPEDGDFMSLMKKPSDEKK